MNKRLRELRKTLRMTQAEFAAKLEMAQNSYSKIETGENSLTEKNIFLICLIFGVDESWLRTGKGEMFDQVSKPKDGDEKKLLEMFRSLSPEIREFVLKKLRECVRIDGEWAARNG
ncbi:MAG: helix-turn-helix domain-containing protein [Treponema sp.]|nr:helix-turn-helix domain-containing protein [Treponema sp.]